MDPTSEDQVPSPTSSPAPTGEPDKELRLVGVDYAARAYAGPMPPPELLRARVLGGGGIATLIWAFRYDRIREQAREEETQEAISHRNTAKPDLGETPVKRSAKKRKVSGAPKLGG